jgi:hypothetical protein
MFRGETADDVTLFFSKPQWLAFKRGNRRGAFKAQELSFA